MKNLAWLSIIVLFLVPSATAHPSKRHGNGVARAIVCGPVTRTRIALPTHTLQTVSANLNGRRLNYWNESPNVSYFYGAATFVEISLPRRTLYVRAVRTVPVCARLRLAYSW